MFGEFWVVCFLFYLCLVLDLVGFDGVGGVVGLVEVVIIVIVGFVVIIFIFFILGVGVGVVGLGVVVVGLVVGIGIGVVGKGCVVWWWLCLCSSRFMSCCMKLKVSLMIIGSRVMWWNFLLLRSLMGVLSECFNLLVLSIVFV